MSFGDNWTLECQEIESIFGEIRADLLKRNKFLQLGNQGDANKVASDIMRKLNFVRNKLDFLRKDLSQRKQIKSITENESRRRQDMIDNFSLERDDLQRQYETTGSFYSFERNSLLDSKNPNQTWGKETQETMNYDNKQLINRQNQTMNDQDKDLDLLIDSIDTLGQMGKEINTELDRHDDLLDGIHTKVDIENRKVQRENKRIEKFEEKSGTCCLWILIILLLAAIIFLGSTGGMCYIIMGKEKCMARHSKTNSTATFNHKTYYN